MKGIILAAGMGDRMKPLTLDNPKPMLPINGRPSLEYLLALFRKYNILDLAITTFYLKEKITDYFKDGSIIDLNITYLDEYDLISSAMAVKQLSSFVDDSTLITNGDNLTNLDLNELANYHNEKNADITIMVYKRKNNDPPSSQVDFLEDGKLLKYRKKISEEEMRNIIPEKRFANMGIYIFNKKVFDFIPDKCEEDIGDMFPYFLEKGLKIYVKKLENRFYFKEIGKMERYLKAKEDIESGKIDLGLNLIRNEIKINSSPENQKLELGSGGKPTPGYLHQDITQIPGVKLDYTCQPWEIPLKEDSLSEVLALGLVEHLRFQEVRETLRHIHKILKKGGSFFFDVPDMRVWSEYLYNLTNGLQHKNLFRPEHIWSTIYGWQRWPGDEHKSGWTEEELIKEVKNAGFGNIELGAKIFREKGIYRGRFNRHGDAHIYIKATK